MSEAVPEPTPPEPPHGGEGVTDRRMPAQGKLVDTFTRLAKTDPSTVGSIFQVLLAVGSPRAGINATPEILKRALDNDAARDRQATTMFVVTVSALVVVAVIVAATFVCLAYFLRDHADKVLEVAERLASHAAVGAGTGLGGYAIGRRRTPPPRGSR